jgi:hypothetical protein
MVRTILMFRITAIFRYDVRHCRVSINNSCAYAMRCQVGSDICAKARATWAESTSDIVAPAILRRSLTGVCILLFLMSARMEAFFGETWRMGFGPLARFMHSGRW